ncbi:MAG: O-antigen ligase family protein [Bacteroidia bacterium]|nr:O-antigen ligase family protein [Bacteroidia bacterium]
MLKFLKEQRRFIFILALWVAAGIASVWAAMVVIPLSVLIMHRLKMYSEILTGFLFVLILSDSRQPMFAFAADVKNVFILVLGAMVLMDRKSFSSPFLVTRNFIIYIVISVFCILLSEFLFNSFQRTLSYVLILTVVPAYFMAAWAKSGMEILRFLIRFGALILVAGFVLRVVNPAFVTLEERYTGLLGNPNGLGLFCTLFIIMISVARDLYKDLLTRREYYTVMALIIFSVLYCGSRNAVVAIGIFFVFVRLYKVSPVFGYLAFVILLVVYQIVLSNLTDIIVALNLQEFFRLETLENASGRIVAWEFGWENIKENIWIGKGIGYTDNLYKLNYAMLSIKGHQGNAHNSFITFWLDTGIFGMLFYVIALIRSFYKGYKRSPSAIPALFAILFSAFFESWLTASLNPFTIICVIVITLLSANLQAEKEEDDTADESTEDETEQLGVLPKPV